MRGTMVDLLESKANETLRTSLANSAELLSLLHSRGSDGESGGAKNGAAKDINPGNLRSSVEQSSLDMSVSFEKVLAGLEAELKGMDEAVDGLLWRATALVENANLARFNNKDGVSDASNPTALISKAIGDRDAAVAKLEALRSFLSKFEIGKSTAKALEASEFSPGSGSRNGPEFLKALHEVGEVRDNLRRAFDQVRHVFIVLCVDCIVCCVDCANQGRTSTQ